MSNKIGIKLFSNNVDDIKTFMEHYHQGTFDYLELMAVPRTYKRTIGTWGRLSVPYIIHAPHSSFGFNLSDPGREAKNRKMFEEVVKYADRLKADHIIVHPGLIGEAGETARQIKRLGDKRIVVENKPFISLLQTRCVGSSPEEIRKIMGETGAGFCLDIAHAVKAAFAVGQNYEDYIKKFMRLRPKIVHLCDCKIAGCFDEHLNYGEGELDLKKIMDMLLTGGRPAFITLETPEISYRDLTSFKKDRRFIGKIIGEARK